MPGRERRIRQITLYGVAALAAVACGDAPVGECQAVERAGHAR